MPLCSSHRLAAATMAVVLWAGLAGPSEASPQAPGETEDVLAEVGELFRRGQDRFETSDFLGAIEQWELAYQRLPDGPEHQAIRAMLLANLAQAHVEAHATGGGVEHLHKAEGLYASYLAMIDPKDVQTRDTIEAEQRRITGLLEEEQERAREEEQERASQPEPDVRAMQPERSKLTTSRSSDGQSPGGRRDRAVEPYSKGERAMMIGGGVTLAFGVGLAGATGAFLWLRNEEEKQGVAASSDFDTSAAELRDFGRNAVRFQSLAISTGTTAGVLVGIGLGLVGTADVHRRRRMRDRAMVSLGPGGTLVVRGRF